MKSYSLELVQRKTGSGLAKLSAAALLGAGAYVGYKRLKKSTPGNARKDSEGELSYDSEAREGEDFTARILRAAKRLVK